MEDDELEDERPVFESGEMIDFSDNGDNSYRIDDLIGEGRCCVVYSAHSVRDNSRVAIKFFKRGSSYEGALQREQYILEMFKDPAHKLVTSFGFHDFKGLHCQVMELLHCNIRQVIFKNDRRGLSPWTLQKFARDILTSLCSLHSSQFVHADLKPANIMWSANEGCFKLLDFGLTFHTSELDLHQIQTKSYQAPEAAKWNAYKDNLKRQRKRKLQGTFGELNRLSENGRVPSNEVAKAKELWPSESSGIFTTSEISPPCTSPTDGPPNSHVLPSMIPDIPPDTLDRALCSSIKTSTSDLSTSETNGSSTPLLQSRRHSTIYMGLPGGSPSCESNSWRQPRRQSAAMGFGRMMLPPPPSRPPPPIVPTEAVDMWSFGCLLFEMVTGSKLIRAGDKLVNVLRPAQVMEMRIGEAEMRLSDHHQEALYEAVKDLITRCLDDDPDTRISSHQALQHDFLMFRTMPKIKEMVLLPSNILMLTDILKDKQGVSESEITDILSDIRSRAEDFGPVTECQAQGNHVYLEFEETNSPFWTSNLAATIQQSHGQQQNQRLARNRKCIMDVTFPFPFPPYDIQKAFMRQLYQVLDQGGFGIFESPTGTGKSMSLICGALTWFNQTESHRKDLLVQRIKQIHQDLDLVQGEDEHEEDWITVETRKRERQNDLRWLKMELEAIEAKEEKIRELKRRRKVIVPKESVQTANSEFDELFRDLQEIREAVKRELASCSGNGDQVFDEEEEAVIVDEYLSEDEGEEGDSNQIFYCSRTHSQLTQFVKEVQKSPFKEDIRLVSLASRQVTCVNPEVKNLPTNALVNERCLDLQKKKTTQHARKETNPKKSKGPGGCPFFKQKNIALLRDQSLLQVMDIEDTLAQGKLIKACPYYSSRMAIEDAQIVVLPYNSLLHKPTRDALGISIKNSIVIVDEAHNLLDTIAHIHSIEISGTQFKEAHKQLQNYMERYRSRLKAKNLLYIKQLIFVLANLIKVLGGKVSGDVNQEIKANPRLIETYELLNEAEIYNMNIFKLVKYVGKSKIGQKLHGFAEKFQNAPKKSNQPEVKKGLQAFLSSVKKCPKGVENTGQTENLDMAADKATPPKSTRSPLNFIAEFLRSLVHMSNEARILVNSQNTLAKSSIKYCLLNPASQFKDLVDQCHSVIVAGGTMQPISEFRDQLFVNAGASLARIQHFSCGHVISRDKILPLTLVHGPSGLPLDFRYGHRDRSEVLDELYRILRNAINIIPGGVVCFFPSYDYESKVFGYFTKMGYIEKLAVKKKVFREPKRSDLMDKVLRDYSLHCVKGALLFSVVGGKMSEGINFNDHLGRCVIMVGLPFPNAHSLELKEKMKYLDQTVAPTDQGRTGGQVHYENLCMKAVNQSIGRAIRHKDDYASILLLDQRYQTPHIQGQLPAWIQEHVQHVNRFPQCLPLLSQFFKSKIN
ncbi:hypothetical protein TCAL_00388 [Tigriopus californicus]|uniref:DNA 5'-3' helicase n=1 Tax=Tigriopus californicus TaxID=6832 RepID=A0A553NBG0_TIGCA|nr:hypothetical protein TCAL_00388 [Tigriopus californicus]